jgi:hypothetical protein
MKTEKKIIWFLNNNSLKEKRIKKKNLTKLFEWWNDKMMFGTIGGTLLNSSNEWMNCWHRHNAEEEFEHSMK